MHTVDDINPALPIIGIDHNSHRLRSLMKFGGLRVWDSGFRV